MVAFGCPARTGAQERTRRTTLGPSSTPATDGERVCYAVLWDGAGLAGVLRPSASRQAGCGSTTFGFVRRAGHDRGAATIASRLPALLSWNHDQKDKGRQGAGGPAFPGGELSQRGVALGRPGGKRAKTGSGRRRGGHVSVLLLHGRSCHRGPDGSWPEDGRGPATRRPRSGLRPQGTGEEKW